MLIKSAKPLWVFSISLNVSQNPLKSMIWWKEARITVPAMTHDWIMRQFVENQRSCRTRPISLRCTHDPFITSHLRFPHFCGTFITPLWGVYRECKYKLLNFFYYPSISYKIENNPSCHVTWWRIATDRWKSAKWSNFAKNRSLTFVTPSQHVNTDRH